MSDRFTVFVQELSEIRDYSMKLDPVLIFISGLARTDFQLSRRDILNFLMVHSEDLCKITDEEYRNNILFKISLGLLEDAKQLLEFRRNWGNDVRHLLYKVRSSGNIVMSAGNASARSGGSTQYPYQNHTAKPPSNRGGETPSMTEGFLIPAPVTQTMQQTIHPTTSSPNDRIKNLPQTHLPTIPNIQLASTMTKNSIKPPPQMVQTDTSISQASSHTPHPCIQPTPQFRSEVLTKHICFFCKNRFGNEHCSNNPECGHLYHTSCLQNAFSRNASNHLACPVQDCTRLINYSYSPNNPSPVACPCCNAVISLATYSSPVKCPSCNKLITLF